jgi:hypothetical protein
VTGDEVKMGRWLWSRKLKDLFPFWMDVCCGGSKGPYTLILQYLNKEELLKVYPAILAALDKEPIPMPPTPTIEEIRAKLKERYGDEDGLEPSSSAR